MLDRLWHKLALPNTSSSLQNHPANGDHGDDDDGDGDGDDDNNGENDVGDDDDGDDDHLPNPTLFQKKPKMLFEAFPNLRN